MYIYYEFVHEVHNKEKMKNKRQKQNKNTKYKYKKISPMGD